MKIAFIQQDMREQFAFILMSAKLKEACHECEVFINEFPKELKDFDIFAFSSSVINFEWNLEKAEYIKALYPGKFIIFGGHHPTYSPEDVIKHDCIDAICIGEGLDAIVELADNIEKIKKDKSNYKCFFDADTENFKIKNLWIKFSEHKKDNDFAYTKNQLRSISNIDDWPRPDYGLYYDKYQQLRNKPTKPVYIVRGCPYQCGFCYNPAFNEMYKGQKIFQCMNVDKAISEIKWLKDTYGFKYLQFMSDNMTINKKWLKEFLSKYIEILKMKIGTCTYRVWDDKNNRKDLIELDMLAMQPFFMNCRANEVTKEIVDQLKDSGCDRVDFGVEHGNDYIRNDVLKRNMSKDQIIRCGKWFKEAGIRVQTTNIFGLPHEDFNKAWESVELNRQFIPEISKACILQPFENTAVYNYAKEKGLLKENMKYSGTTYQIGVKDNRSDESKIIIDNEKQVIRLSYLFDWFVKNRLPKWIGFIICSLPLDRYYKKYYAKIFKEHERKYKLPEKT